MNTTQTHFPGCITSLPDEATLKRKLDEMNRATEKIAAERERMGFTRNPFASKVKQAVRALQQARFTASASASANDDESFAQKIKEAVEKKRPKPAKKDGDRYPG